MRCIQCLSLFLWTICLSADAWQKLEFSSIDASMGLSDNQVQHIMQLRDGRMAVTTRGNINIYDGGSFKYIHTPNRAIHNLRGYNGAYHVYEDRSERLWVKDFHTLRCFDLRQNMYINIDSVVDFCKLVESVDDIFFDHEGDMWVVSKGILVQNENCSTYRFSGGSYGSRALLDLEKSGDCVYLFFNDGSVECWNMKKCTCAYTLKYGHPTHTSLISYVDGRFYQLRNTKSGGACYEFDTKERRWHLVLEVPYTLHTIAIRDDKEALISCPEGVWSVKLNTGESKLVTELVIDGKRQAANQFNTVFIDNQMGIWLGSYNKGLLYAHPYRHLLRSYNQPFLSVHGLILRSRSLRDSRGWLWEGTNDGLRLTVNGLPMMLYSENGLSNDLVQAIVEDKEGDIWVSTGNGISRIAFERNVINSRLPEMGDFHIEPFFQDDGALKGEYKCEAYVTDDGKIVFIGLDGYTVVDPALLETHALCLHPMMVRCEVNGEISNGCLHGLIGKAALSFDFASLNFAQPNHTAFRYRLLSDKDRSDSLWTVVTASAAGGVVSLDGMLHLQYPRLTSGDYKLQVQATNKQGEWKGEITEVAFAISPEWWNTTLARVCFIVCVVVILTLVWLSYQRIQYQKQREETLLARIKDLIELSEGKHENIAELNLNDTGGNYDDGAAVQDPLVKRAIELVEQHIGEQGYNVKQLSSDLCMDRTGLYKKMNAILEQSPSVFIRTIKLRKAYELISTTDIPIMNIAELTGFSSASYLSKCIQAEYGKKPAELRKQE